MDLDTDLSYENKNGCDIKGSDPDGTVHISYVMSGSHKKPGSISVSGSDHSDGGIRMERNYWTSWCYWHDSWHNNRYMYYNEGINTAFGVIVP